MKKNIARSWLLSSTHTTRKNSQVARPLRGQSPAPQTVRKKGARGQTARALKKGQVTTQIFIYVVAAAVFLSILFFGYKAVANLIDHQETVRLVDFKTDLERNVERLKTNRGSVDLITLRTPGKATTLCMIDSTGSYKNIPELATERPQLHDAWKTGTENIFFLPKQETALYIANISIDNGHFCNTVKGSIQLRIEGIGRAVHVKPVVV